jgi:hypothetical protein
MADTEATATQNDTATEHPEFLVGAALLGGIILAQVLKRLGADD